MKTLFPILFILVAGGILFGFINPTWSEIKVLREEEEKYNSALDRSRLLQETRDQLLSRYNTFSPAELARLEKFLPDNVDNVRLILDIDSIAGRYGMRIRDVILSSDTSRTDLGQLGPDENRFDSRILSFSVTGSYTEFRAFLEDLEQSLRLVDVMKITFSSTDSGVYDYSLSIKTYWLKP
ncbi:hypothetical protein COU15_02205 [Candidatus Kaiserbacteria bacterium CG10_big_fil_rev_8_21_14_0_10_45_20]|uniref:Pilus assembly protein PilO n=1 Tax=Candidatus Kaiserbacteria bacterium CG10_big_fil_rev_8_21_14_0_10_45_20 TaxID=1974607 RepID=A0A2H0UFM4_9BACT|nr:MAG: hypothetical protein COU15_02205 [Candidatus Kaiserbacteria bacterium CG10_big_fil_rev_8_21_14_0_10_45_20]